MFNYDNKLGQNIGSSLAEAPLRCIPPDLRSHEIVFLLRLRRIYNLLLYLSAYPLQVGRMGQTKRKNN